MENHHAIHGQINYKWPCSIVFCMFTRPGMWREYITHKTWERLVRRLRPGYTLTQVLASQLPKRDPVPRGPPKRLQCDPRVASWFKKPSNHIWLVVDLPLWTIWWNSQYIHGKLTDLPLWTIWWNSQYIHGKLTGQIQILMGNIWGPIYGKS